MERIASVLFGAVSFNSATEDGQSPQSPRTDENTDTDELTSCPICFERYVKPKYLPCVHTFCEACLQSYITKGQSERPAGFKCPLCRKFVPAPGNPDMPSEWAALLPVNHFIESLMDRNNSKSAEKLCQPCQKENESKIATTWCKDCMEAMCENCSKYHRRNSSTQFHQLDSIEQIAFDNLTVSSDILNCDEHNDKSIEFYCTEHDLPCCITCVTLFHRGCKSVNSISKAAFEFRKSTEAHNLMEKLKRKQGELLDAVKRQTENLAEIEEDAKQISPEIVQFADDMIKHMQRLKTESLDMLAEVKRKESRTLNEGKDRCENMANLLQSYLNVVSMAQKHGSDMYSFLEYQRIRQLYDNLKIRQQEDIVTHFDTVKIKWDVCFSLNNAKNAFRRLGIIAPRKRPHVIYKSEVDLMVAIPELVWQGKAPDDAVVSDAIFISGGRLLLADKSQPRLLLIDEGGKFLTWIDHDRTVFRMDFFRGEEALLSFRDERIVQKMDPEHYKFGEKIPLQFPCRVASRCNDGFVYGTSEKVVYKFDMKGRSNKVCSCLNPYCIKAFDADHIFYANYSDHTLHCVTSNGTQKFLYDPPDLIHPFSLDVDYQGNIYVLGLTSLNLHQVSFDGKRSRILLQCVGGLDTGFVKFRPGSSEFLVTLRGGRALARYKMNGAQRYF